MCLRLSTKQVKLNKCFKTRHLKFDDIYELKMARGYKMMHRGLKVHRNPSDLKKRYEYKDPSLQLVSYYTSFTRIMCCRWPCSMETGTVSCPWDWPVILHQWDQWLHDICHKWPVICLWLHTHCSNCCHLNNLLHWVLTLQCRIHDLYNLIPICKLRQGL